MMMSVAYRSLLGLLCLSESLRLQVEAVSFPCRSLQKVKQGSIVTTNKYGSKLWCGQPSGKFLAVQPDKLFHLQCPSGVESPREAKGAIYDLANLTSGTQIIFEQNEMCSVVLKSFSTGYNAEILAQKLDGVTVPFNGVSCNAQHYIEYLSLGTVISPSVGHYCPVFNTFTSRNTINPPVFRLKDKNGQYYNWPPQDNAGALTLAGNAGMNRVPSNTSHPSRSNSKGSRSKGFFGRRRTIADEDKKGAAGAGVGGHLWHGAGGGGGALHRHHSGASAGPKPFWSGALLKLPSWSRWSSGRLT
ncbi:uncharacterized protein [Bemisia tabaci]|uniref:uncharacterized protein n=1 Tax=Bemisia tabaci TaxID=7038 RepID=UPI003B286E78